MIFGKKPELQLFYFKRMVRSVTQRNGRALLSSTRVKPGDDKSENKKPKKCSFCLHRKADGGPLQQEPERRWRPQGRTFNIPPPNNGHQA